MSISSVDLGFKNTHILSSRHLRSRRLDLPPDRAGSVGLLPPVFSSFISQQRLRKYIVSYATCAVLPPEHIWTAQASIFRHKKLEKRLLHPRRCVSSRRHPPLEHTSELWVPLDCLLPCILYSRAELHRDSSLDNIGACVLELGGQFRITTQDATTAARWFRPAQICRDPGYQPRSALGVRGPTSPHTDVEYHTALCSATYFQVLVEPNIPESNAQHGQRTESHSLSQRRLFLSEDICIRYPPQILSSCRNNERTRLPHTHIHHREPHRTSCRILLQTRPFFCFAVFSGSEYTVGRREEGREGRRGRDQRP